MRREGQGGTELKEARDNVAEFPDDFLREQCQENAEFINHFFTEPDTILQKVEPELRGKAHFVLDNLEHTSLTPIKFHLYNFICSHGELSPNDLLTEFFKSAQLSEIEKKYRIDGAPLPTIGVEVEVGRDFLTPDKRDVLRKLGISEGREANTRLEEVRTDFSYSPTVQSRMLQELANMKALPLTKGQISYQDGSTREITQVNPNYPISLHMNFAIPISIGAEDLDARYKEIDLLIDILTYAFSSKERLLAKKTADHMFLKSALVSERDSSKSFAPKRLELRTCELRDLPTYRMLAETQALIGALISAIDYYPSFSGPRPVEADLAIEWRKFQKEAQKFHEQFIGVRNLHESMRNSEERWMAAFLAANPQVKKGCRDLISKYSRRVKRYFGKALAK